MSGSTFRPPVLVVYREGDSILPYRDALLAAGAEPTISNARAGISLDGFAGLLLTGGSDIDAALYGEERGPHTDLPDTERDQLEYQLLDQALLVDLPVLAICRGLQILNAHHGGSLIQHLEPPERHQKVDGTRAMPIHTVSIDPASRLGAIAEAPEWRVNSRHHQAIARVGKSLRVTATSPDGIIEAVERPDKMFVVAVQWHPEDQVFECPEQLSLFASFQHACAAAAQSLQLS